MTESGLTPAGPGPADPDPGDAPPDGIQALTEEIERTREDVGQTVAALAAKADIKARLREEEGEVAGRLRDTAGKVKEQIMAVPRQRRVVLTAACAVLLAGVLIARLRRR
jgi:Protein of unknown function (DUF3618)